MELLAFEFFCYLDDFLQHVLGLSHDVSSFRRTQGCSGHKFDTTGPAAFWGMFWSTASRNSGIEGLTREKAFTID